MLLEMTGIDCAATAAALSRIGYAFDPMGKLWRGTTDASVLIRAGVVREVTPGYEMIYAMVVPFEFDGKKELGGSIFAARGEYAKRQIVRSGIELCDWFIEGELAVRIPDFFTGLMVFEGSVKKILEDENGSTDAVFEGVWRLPTRDEVLSLFYTSEG